MKVFISADIEGVAGLATFEESRMEDIPAYNKAVIEMSREAAAACRGAMKAGAAETYVMDAHGAGRNIILEYLPKETKLIRGIANDPYSMIGGIDKSYGAVMFIGYHDAAGSDGNPTSHTISSKVIREIKINGELAGEMHIFLYAAAYLGIPTVLVSGDNEICRKAKKMNNNIFTIGTKEGKGNAISTIHPELAQELIEERAEKALKEDLNKYKIELPKHFEIEVSYAKHFDALNSSYYPGVMQTAPHAVKYESDDYYEILRFLFFTI